MFQSFASYQPFQGGNNPNKATASNSAPMSSSLATPNVQPQNTGGPLTSSLLNTVNNAAEKGASNLMGGSSADAKNQLMATLAKGGNPIAQSAIAPTTDGTMKQADPSQADGAQGWFDGLLNTVASNSPSSTAAGASSISPVAAGGTAVPAASGDAAAAGGGDAAASGAASSGAADSSAGSFLDWL